MKYNKNLLSKITNLYGTSFLFLKTLSLGKIKGNNKKTNALHITIDITAKIKFVENASINGVSRLVRKKINPPIVPLVKKSVSSAK